MIRRFLDAQRIHNLTRYLQVLHEKVRVFFTIVLVLELLNVCNKSCCSMLFCFVLFSFCDFTLQGRANKDHTTLLLNCYTKLKDVQKLDEFVRVG